MTQFGGWRQLGRRLVRWARGDRRRAPRGRPRPEPRSARREAGRAVPPQHPAARGPGSSPAAPHIRLVDATRYDMGPHVARLLAPLNTTPVRLDEPHSSRAVAVVALFPVDQPSEATSEAVRYLSDLAVECEYQGTPVPVILVWCVRAAERVDAVLSHRNHAGWRNHISLTTAGAWTTTRASHQDDGTALRAIDDRMSELFSAASHNTAVGGNTQRVLHYVDRIAQGRSHLSMLAECLAQPGQWHGHDMLSAAALDLLPEGPPAAPAPVEAERAPASEVQVNSAILEGWGSL